ncbi:MAG: polysaccharide pyruvyl transferase family protein [Erysipelotrichaceae bacterium]
MKKKHLLYAFTQNNLGDDLFIKILCERYPNHKFYIGLENENINDTLKNIKNLHFDNKLLKIDEQLKKESFFYNHFNINFNINKKTNEKYLKSFDSAIYIIGSAFIQNNPNKDYTNLYLLEKRVKLSNKFFLLNTNFGPYHDEKYLNFSKKIVNNMTHATFRDKFSYDLFKDLKKISYAPDLVLTLKNNINTSNNTILISIMDLNDEYINLLVKLIKTLNNKGFNCKLVSFCKNQNDEIAANKIINQVNVEALTYNGNINEILNEFKKCYGVISTRFHSMIIAMAYNKPFLPFIYSKKTNEILDDISYKNTRLDINNLDNIDVIKTIDEFLTYDYVNIDSYKNKAEDQFKALDIYLNN